MAGSDDNLSNLFEFLRQLNAKLLEFQDGLAAAFDEWIKKNPQVVEAGRALVDGLSRGGEALAKWMQENPTIVNNIISMSKSHDTRRLLEFLLENSGEHQVDDLASKIGVGWSIDRVRAAVSDHADWFDVSYLGDAIGTVKLTAEGMRIARAARPSIRLPGG